MSKMNNNFYTSGQSKEISPFESYMDPEKLSRDLENMQGDVLEKPVKYEKPRYSQVKKTYEVRESITEEPVIMPERISKKIRETKPVFQQPIYVEGKEALNKAL